MSKLALNTRPLELTQTAHAPLTSLDTTSRALSNPEGADRFQKGGAHNFAKLLGYTPPVTTRGVDGLAETANVRPPEFSPDNKVYAVELQYGSVFGTEIKASRLDQKLKAFNPAIPVEGVLLDGKNGRGKPTDVALESYLEKVGQKAKPGDTVMITLSSHGSPPGQRTNAGDTGPFEWDLDADVDKGKIGLNQNLTENELADMIRKHIPEDVNVAVFTTACHSGDAKDNLGKLPHNLLYAYGAEAPDTVSAARGNSQLIPSGEFPGKTTFQVATEKMFSKDPDFSASTNGNNISFSGIARTYDRAVDRVGVHALQRSPGAAIHKLKGDTF